MVRGLDSAASTAGLVISWKTTRSGSLSLSASARCQAIASPSRSGSEASSTVSALRTAARSSRTWASLVTSYSGANPPSMSTPSRDLGRSRT